MTLHDLALLSAAYIAACALILYLASLILE